MSFLYHYTDQFGCLGILSNKEIWASKIIFMNDSKEFKIGLEYAISYLRMIEKSLINESQKKQCHRWIKTLIGAFESNVFVFSMSECNDQLSQWRGYANSSTGGYCIEFNVDELKKDMSKLGFELDRCKYNRKEWSHDINKIIEKIRSEFPSENENNLEKDSSTLTCPSCLKLVNEITKYISYIKDENFHEEKEWRFVSIDCIDYNSINYRGGQHSIVPYVKIPLSTLTNKIVSGITIMDRSNQNLAKSAVKDLLLTRFYIENNHNGEVNFDTRMIKISKIPYH